MTPRMETITEVTWNPKQPLKRVPGACPSDGWFGKPNPRFIELGPTVLDRETCLLWTKLLIYPMTLSYRDATYKCDTAQVGGRGGWHLPTLHQLMSLLDFDVAGYPKMTPGHPFLIPIAENFYWTSTVYDSAPGDYQIYNYIVKLKSGEVDHANIRPDTKELYSVVCVRGGQTNQGIIFP